MRSRTRWIGRRWLALAVVGIGVAAIGGTALAGHMTSGVRSYTGCLVSKDGVIIKVKEGNEPAGPCTGGMTQVHLSGGDITKISVTGALTGGGENGEVTIGLKPEFTLPTGCATGQVAKWNGTGWACAVDNDTTYSAGTGLDLSAADAFGIAPDYRVKNTPDCGSGQFAQGFDSDGVIQCAAPSAGGGGQLFVASTGAMTLGGFQTVLSKALPAGKYLLFAEVELENKDNDSQSTATCGVDAGGGQGSAARTTIPGDVLAYGSLSVTAAVTHTGGNVVVHCTENDADVDIYRAHLIALAVDSIG